MKNRNTIKYIFVFILLFPMNLHYYSQARKTSDTKEFFYNVSFGAIIGGIGALINKKPEQKFEKILLKGMYQGALGGYITFESKRLVRTAVNNDDFKLLWVAKLVNAGGTSIKENASMNRNFWEKWHINFGFNRIEFDTKDKFKVHYKVLPINLVYTIGVALQTKFELEKTLKTGEFIFSSNTERFPQTNSIGRTFPGAIVLYEPFKSEFSLVAHEIIHIYQSNDFSQFDPFITKPLNYYNSKSKTFSKINQYLYLDLRHLPELLSYLYEDRNAIYYYDNRFEREAGHYSKTFDENTIK